MLSSMLVFVLWKPYSTSFHAKTLTELTLQTFSNKQRSFKSFPMHIHNVTLVKISLERRPRAFVHSFGHAKHRLLPSQIPYYSYARNLVSLDHVNSTFSQLVVFRQCRSKVLGHLARYYWNNLPSPPPPQAMLRFDTTTQISTKILFICIFQHCLGGRGVVRSNCDPKKPTLLGIHDYWTGVPTTFDLHCLKVSIWKRSGLWPIGQWKAGLVMRTLVW